MSLTLISYHIDHSSFLPMLICDVSLQQWQTWLPPSSLLIVQFQYRCTVVSKLLSVFCQYILILFCSFFFSFTQIRELEPLLCHSDSPSQLIWTSSRNARKSNFSLEDFQHSKGKEPYSSSKYATDLLSVALNRNFNQQVRPISVIWKWQGRFS